MMAPSALHAIVKGVFAGVRNNLGHASLKTTSVYLHVDDDRRHQETEDKHRVD